MCWSPPCLPLSGAPTPRRWSSSSWRSASTSSSTSSTHWRPTWPRRVCCRRWRRLPPRPSTSGGGGAPERRGGCTAPAPPQLWEVAGAASCEQKTHQRVKKNKQTTRPTRKKRSFHFIWARSVFTRVSDGSAFRSTQYITVLSHISILYLSHRGTAVLFYLYPRYPRYTCWCVLIFLLYVFFVVVFNALPSTVTHCNITPRQNLGFIFLYCGRFYLYIDGFYICCVLYLNVVSVTICRAFPCVCVCRACPSLLFIVPKPPLLSLSSSSSSCRESAGRRIFNEQLVCLWYTYRIQSFFLFCFFLFSTRHILLQCADTGAPLWRHSLSSLWPGCCIVASHRCLPLCHFFSRGVKQKKRLKTRKCWLKFTRMKITLMVSVEPLVQRLNPSKIIKFNAFNLFGMGE